MINVDVSENDKIILEDQTELRVDNQSQPFQRADVPVFRIGENAPPIINLVLSQKGWKVWTEGMAETKWHIFWQSVRFKPSEYSNALPHQRLNHFQKTGAITRKDNLLRQLRTMRAVHGAIYNFTPTSFILPNEYTKFVKEYTAQESPSAWICKPSDLARGQKIFLFSNLSDLIYDQTCVLQRYIERPLLIGGYKQDLRVYVLVTSFHPMEAFVYRDGLVRFSTEKYCEDLSNLFSHLTNSSVNKFSPSLDQDKDIVGVGCKWGFEQFRNWMISNFGEEKLQAVWGRIRNVINLTLLILAPVVPDNPSSFELFGFDILIDESLNPFLIEVNCSPALGLDCEIDNTVKLPLVSDIMEVVGIESLARSQQEAPQPDKQAVKQSNSQSKLPAARLQKRPERSKNQAPTHSKGNGVTNADAKRKTNTRAIDSKIVRDTKIRGRSDGNGRSKSVSESASLPEEAYKRTVGNFELLFPFNEVSQQQSVRLSRYVLSTDSLGSVVNECITAIVSEIKSIDRIQKRILLKETCHENLLLPELNNLDAGSQNSHENNSADHESEVISNGGIEVMQTESMLLCKTQCTNSEQEMNGNSDVPVGSGFFAVKHKLSSQDLTL